MAVLETMAGINAAYAIIKSTIENGRELSSCAQAIGKFASGQKELEKIHQQKSNSLWVKLAGTDASDLETFMHKEKVKRMENNLREYMQLYGRGGMWGDYQKYCAEARKDRARAIREKQLARKKIVDIFAGILLSILLVAFISFIIFMGWLIYTEGSW